MDKDKNKPDHYLKNAEMATEANSNMIDGILNNAPPPRDDLTDGQTYEEMKNLAPESLPEARQEKRRSVMEMLKATEKPAFVKRKEPSGHEIGR